MKKNIHPKYNKEVKMTCLSCNNSFVTGSTMESVSTEICSQCHPFYTGVEKIVDTDNLVAKFEKRQEKAKPSFRNKKMKMVQRKKANQKEEKKTTGSLTLKDMLSSIKE